MGKWPRADYITITTAVIRSFCLLTALHENHNPPSFPPSLPPSLPPSFPTSPPPPPSSTSRSRRYTSKCPYPYKLSPTSFPQTPSFPPAV